MNTTKTNLKRHFTTNRLSILCIALLLNFAGMNAHAQVKLAIGASMSHAPNLTYGSNMGSANLLNLYGDLVMKGNIIVRGQLTTLLVGSYKGDNDDRLNSGFSASGSFGYNAVVANGKIEIPIMASIGYAHLWYEGFGGTTYNASMQFGGAIAPMYFVTERLAITTEARYLKGTGAFGGAQIDIMSISGGLRFVLF